VFLNVKQVIAFFLTALLFASALLIALFAPEGTGLFKKEVPWGLFIALSLALAAGGAIAASRQTYLPLIRREVAIQNQIDRIIHKDPRRQY